MCRSVRFPGDVSGGRWWRILRAWTEERMCVMLGFHARKIQKHEVGMQYYDRRHSWEPHSVFCHLRLRCPRGARAPLSFSPQIATYFSLFTLRFGRTYNYMPQGTHFSLLLCTHSTCFSSLCLPKYKLLHPVIQQRCPRSLPSRANPGRIRVRTDSPTVAFVYRRLEAGRSGLLDKNPAHNPANSKTSSA